MPDLTEFLLFQLSYNNLDSHTQQAFDLKFERSDVTPTTTDLLDYIRLLAKTDEMKKDINAKHQFGWQNPKSHLSEIRGKEKNTKNVTKLRCSYCHQEHFLAYCPDFKTKAWRDRKEFILREKLCGNCLGAHSVTDCWSQKTCKLCHQKHHSLLYPMHENNSASAREDKVSTHFSHQNRAVLLSTATIIIGSDQNCHTARALIDQGSEASFISESLVQRLRMKRMASSTVVSGVGATTCAVTRGCVRFNFASRHKPEAYFTTEALILPKLTDYIPPKTTGFPPPEVDQLILADENVFSNQPIEVILGVEIYAQILQEGILRIYENTVLLQNTRLGWILCGALSSKKNQLITMDGRTIGGKINQSGGGVARNIADALGKLQMKPCLVSAVGDEQFGNFILNRTIPHLSTKGMMRSRDASTGTCMVLCDHTGECLVVVGDMGIHEKITTDHVKGQEKVIAESDLVVLDGNLSLETTEFVLRLCHDCSVPVWFEPTDVFRASKPFLKKGVPLPTFISPNFWEFNEIFNTVNPGFPIEETTNIIEECIKKGYLLAELIGNIIITMGKNGVMVIRKGEASDPFFEIVGKRKSFVIDKPISHRIYQPSLIGTEEIINVSGAGDCFASGFIAAMLKGEPEERCIETGFKCSTASLRCSQAVPETF